MRTKSPDPTHSGPQRALRDIFQDHDVRWFLALAALGAVASHLNIKIPYTGTFIEGRWIFGYMGFALLRRWWAALLLGGLLSVTLIYQFSVAQIFFGNMLYAFPIFLVVRALHPRMLKRLPNIAAYGAAWLGLMLVCYQLFTTPAVWGVVAFYSDAPVVPAIFQGWQEQPYLFESLLVGIISALGLMVVRVNADLRTSRQEFATTLYSIGDGVIATDAAGRVRRMNAVAEQLTGWTETEAAGQPLDAVFRIVDETSRQPVQSPIAQVLADGVVVGLSNHTLLIARDGAEYPIADSGAPIRDAAGQMSGTVLVFRDQTKERAAQRQLEQQHQRLLLALRNARMGIWDWDVAADQVEWSVEHAEVFGLPAGQVIDSMDDALRIVHPDERDRLQQALQQAVDTGAEFDHVYRIVRPDDQSMRWLHSRGRMSRDDAGRPRRFIGTTQDVTEAHRIEDALRDSEARYRTILENFPNGALFLFDRDFRYLAANGRAFKPAGLSSEQVVGRTVAEVFPGLWGMIQPYCQRVLEGYDVYYEAEYGGRLYSNEGLPVVDDQGEIRQGLIIVQDITGRRQAEEQIQRALSEKDVLLRELYHRTKNNMQVIQSMLALEAARRSTPEVQSLVDDMRRRIQAMALVHQQLCETQDLSYITMGEYLRHLTHALMHSFQPFSTNIRLNLALEPTSVLMDTAIPCGLLVNELVTNALKHAFPDYTTGDITIQFQRLLDDDLRLVVADNGVGFPAEFDPRAQGALGLQTVIALVEHQLQGSIRFLDAQPGVVCDINFRDDLYAPRV